MRTIKLIFWIVIIAMLSGLVLSAVNNAIQAESCQDNGKCAEVPDPDRDYYGPDGHKYNYKGEPIECAPGYVDRGGCVKFTNCPHGDTMEPDVCAKFDEPKPQVKAQQQIRPIESWGK